jgi:putative membrane protein
MAAARGGVLLALPVALAATTLLGSHLWLGDQNMYLFAAFFTLFYLPFRLLVNRLPRLKQLFLSGREVEEEVEEAAITAFYGEGLYRTRQENGILLFVSVLERKVWILGDRGINDRIDPGQWDAIVDELSNGIKNGHQGEALCRAVGRVGEMLRTHFPYQRNDTDELHNLIIR